MAVNPCNPGPDDPQLSPFLAHRQHLKARLHRVHDTVSHAPREVWDAQRMAAGAAEAAGFSSDLQLRRAFRVGAPERV